MYLQTQKLCSIQGQSGTACQDRNATLLEWARSRSQSETSQASSLASNSLSIRLSRLTHLRLTANSSRNRHTLRRRLLSSWSSALQFPATVGHLRNLIQHSQPWVECSPFRYLRPDGVHENKISALTLLRGCFGDGWNLRVPLVS